MTHMLSLLPKSRFEESGVEIPGGLAFLADYRPDAIAEASAGIEGLFMPPSHPRLDADLLARLGSVRIIQTAGAGFDSVDHAAAAKLGLIVCNSPAQNAITVAEHVIGAVICLQRELAYADEAIKSGAYAQARERILGRGACELFGATVGIVGLGGIGRALAPRLAAFGATVVASDVFWPEDFAQDEPAEKDDQNGKEDNRQSHTEAYGLLVVHAGFPHADGRMDESPLTENCGGSPRRLFSRLPMA